MVLSIRGITWTDALNHGIPECELQVSVNHYK